MACRFPSNYPKVLLHGKGCYVRGDDGIDYIDFISGLGAISVGYADIMVNGAVKEQLEKGCLFSLPIELEYLAAKTLTELIPGTEMWKFGKNGTDGTVMAVRAARAYTGRTKILTVGYNGCADQFEIKGVRNAGIPKELEGTIDKALYNDIKSFSALNSRDYACVLMEPMVIDFPNGYFLEKVKDLCHATGTLLIFDEVVTGGRFEGFSASRYFEVVPDMYVFGKAIANGLPLCAVGGSRQIMQTFERDDFFASGTFGAECLSLAAFIKTQELLTKALPQMYKQGLRVKEAFNMAFKSKAVCNGYPTRLAFEFPSDEYKYLFWQLMAEQSILLGHNNFIMASHMESDINYVIRAINSVCEVMLSVWHKPLSIFKGPLPSMAVRKV